MATQQETDDLAQLLLSRSDVEPADAEINVSADDTILGQEAVSRSRTASGDFADVSVESTLDLTNCSHSPMLQTMKNLLGTKEYTWGMLALIGCSQLSYCLVTCLDSGRSHYQLTLPDLAGLLPYQS